MGQAEPLAHPQPPDIHVYHANSIPQAPFHDAKSCIRDNETISLRLLGLDVFIEAMMNAERTATSC